MLGGARGLALAGLGALLMLGARTGLAQGNSGQPTAQPNVPKLLEAEDARRIAELVVANHIVADQGIIDTFGHLSVRSAKDPSHFYMSRARAPGMVEASDIIELDKDSTPINANGRHPYVERFIHGEIYRVRPDVQGIVHSHSPNVIPFGLTDVPLRAVYLLGAFLGQDVPVFEIRKVDGDSTNLLISDRKRGAALAKVLGQGDIVLMRGHGDTVVGPSLKMAVRNAINAEFDARIEMDALLLGHGKITAMTPGESAILKKGSTNPAALGRAWEVWKTKALADYPIR